MGRLEVRVADNRDLHAGDALTFFYPSSEWHMVQPFDCTCGTQKCLGRITGSSAIEPNVLARYWLNDNIKGALQNGSAVL